MNNFKILLKYSWKQKFQGKSAKIWLLVMAVLCMAAPILLTMLFNAFDTPTTVGVYGSNEANTNEFIEYLNDDASLNEDYVFEYSSEFENEDYEFIINIDEFYIYSKNTDTDYTTAPLQNYLASIKQQEFLINNNLDLDFLNKFMEESNVPIIYAEGSENDFIYWSISYGGSILIFMILTFVIQLIGAEISEEKSSRAMEIIMTSCSPMKHMLSKIITNVGYLLLNIVTIVISLIIGLGINNIYLDKAFFDVSFITDFFGAINENFDLTFILLYIILFISTILIVSTIAAAIASTVTSPSDFAKSIAPLTMLLLIPYMIALFPLPDDLIQILAYIPLFSMFLYPTLLLKLSLPLITTIIIIVINVAATFIIIKVSSNLYKYGVLNYSGAPLKKIIKDSIKSNKK